MAIGKELMQEIFNDGYDEEWKVVLNTGGKYILNRVQAKVLQEQIANGGRGIVMFQTYTIPVAYIAEFYRTRRFKVGQKELPARASEKPYEPMPPEKWAKFKKKVYQKIGKIPKEVK